MEIDFIPIQFYTPLYWCVIIFATVLTNLESSNSEFDLQPNIESYQRTPWLGYGLAIFTILYMGFRPIHPIFVDMGAYAEALVRLQNGAESAFQQDPGFATFILVSSKLMTPNFFILSCSIVYIIPVIFACRRWSPRDWQLLFVAALGSFAFWAYGVNGIRNGLATSLLLCAFSLRSFWPRLIFTALAISFHKSAALPAVGFYLASTRIDIKWFFGFWVITIPASYVLGGFWEQVFSGLGFADDRIGGYITSSLTGDTVLESSFRFDFLLYGASGVVAGFYYVYYMFFEDFVYKRILGTYLFANGMWVLVIRADFSNRFAYLSWFLLAFVIFYPLVTAKMFHQQRTITGLLLFLYCIFSAYMGVFRNF